MDARRALVDKRDTRNYTDDPVDAGVVDRLLGAARMAGSAKNRQPIRLVVVSDQETKEALRDAGDFAGWIDTAPVVVVVTVAGDAGPRALFDVGRHSQNLMVAAHAEGLASCPVTIHHPDVARRVLGIPDDVDPSMIVTLGHPAPSTGPSRVAGARIPLTDYVHRGRWAAE